MDELHQTLLPLVKILKIFGFFPYNVEPNGNFKISWYLVSYEVTMFACSDYLIYLQYIHMYDYIQQGSFLAQISVFLIVVMTQIFIFYIQIMNYINRDVLGSFLRTLWMFDEEVS